MQIWCKYHILAGFLVAFTVSSEATVYNSSDCVHSKIKKTLILMCPKHIVDLNILICVYIHKYSAILIKDTLNRRNHSKLPPYKDTF